MELQTISESKSTKPDQYDSIDDIENALTNTKLEDLKEPFDKNDNSNQIIHIDLSKLADVKEVVADHDLNQNQDFNQRYNVVSSVLLELYRVITCSLLILFIPQKCGEQVCTISQNMSWGTGFYNTAVILNFVTLFAFCPLYYIEIVRENRFIKYLHVNQDKPNDEKAVTDTLAIMPEEKKQKIDEIDKQYQQIAYAIMAIYFVNALFSGIVIFDYYLSSQTATVYITYVLFIMSKLVNVYTIANTPKNIFYSAYLKTNLQYNDVDADLQKTLMIVDTIIANVEI
jgi:hypothetical protein